MKGLTILAALAAIAQADLQPIKLGFTVYRGDSAADAAPGRSAQLVRRDAFSMELVNAQSFYYSELDIGSNKDKVRVLVDTGSSDLWVMSHDVDCRSVRGSRKRDVSDLKFVSPHGPQIDDHSNLHKRADGDDNVFSEIEGALSQEIAESQVPLGPAGGGATLTATTTTGGGSRGSGGSNSCTALGSFDTANSESFQRNSSAPQFNILYGDGSQARGIWGHDDVTIHNVTVNDLSFAVANISSSDVGVFGIGFAGLETTFSSNRAGRPYTYENYPMKLVSQGIIAKNAFSLYLNEMESSTGTVLFGAVDHAKYKGQLQTVPIVNSLRSMGYTSPIRTEINLTGLSLNNSQSQADISTSSYAALLDSGSTLSYLPSDMLSAVASSVNARYSSQYGYHIISCSAMRSSTNLIFDFSGVKIVAPLSDFVLQASSSICVLGLLEETKSSSREPDSVLLGDNFLRNAYVVYDLDDETISLAQVNHTDDEDIEIIRSDIPGASAVSGAATAAGTGGPIASGTAVFSGSASRGSSSTRRSSSRDDSATPYVSMFLSMVAMVVSLVV